MQALKKNIVILSALAAMLLLAVTVLGEGEPTAPMSLVRGDSSTFDWSNFVPKSTVAQAGNITWLTIHGISQTRAWQGYYGNVTGTITLDDANNFTFYNWSAAEPRGQIYATLVNNPSWLDVNCFDHANNATNFHTTFGINVDDYDNVTLTYNRTDHPEFYIVNNSRTLCPTTYIWRDDLYQQEDFVNVLLWDATQGNNGWVFATMMENKDVGNKTDITCYNGDLCDFQLLVAEDGHGTDTATTTYYFWVDIDG